MSFFNSLQQYVSDSVANLSLSPKRFSFSREDSATSASGRSGSTGSVTGTTNTNSTAQQSTPHGYPKVRNSFENLYCKKLENKKLENGDLANIVPRKIIFQSSVLLSDGIFHFRGFVSTWYEIYYKI